MELKLRDVKTRKVLEVWQRGAPPAEGYVCKLQDGTLRPVIEVLFRVTAEVILGLPVSAPAGACISAREALGSLYDLDAGPGTEGTEPGQ